MSTRHHKCVVSVVPAFAGTACAVGAVGLLVSDAIVSGRWNINHALQPLLVFGTLTAAALAHRAGWRRPFSALAFILLAMFGSAATVWGTLGRTADSRDTRSANVAADMRTLELKQADLETARADAKRECRSGFGPRCTAATQRVDRLSGELADVRPVSSDPRADAIANLAHLVAGIEQDHTRAVVTAVDPLVLPGFLEFASIVFWASAIRKRKVVSRTDEHFPTVDAESSQKVLGQFDRDAALADFRRLRETGAQKVLAHRWSVSESCVSKWLTTWESDGLVNRRRSGKERPVLALPAPTRS